MAGFSSVRCSYGVFQRQFQLGARICSPIQNFATKNKDVGLPAKPKGPLRDYIAYLQEIRPELSKQNPGLKLTEYSRLGGQKWQLLSAEDKNKYKPTEASLNDYKAAMQKWKESLTEEQLASMQAERDRKKKLKLKKRVEQLGKPPKPPMNGFAQYLKLEPIERGDAPASMYMQGLSQQWNKMPVDDKAPYEAEATKQKIEYFAALDTWEKEMISAGHYDVVRKSSLPANIDRKTLKPKTKKPVKKQPPKKTASKKGKAAAPKKSTKKAKKTEDEDASWMREE